MKKINLLPEKVQKSKDVRRITIILAAVQAAFFLMAILLFAFFSIWEARLSREAQSLESYLRQRAPVQPANETIHYFFHGEFLTEDALANAQAVPNGIRLYAMRFNHGQMSITAHTADILKIQAHIKNLSEFFYGIRLASLAATDGCTYIYELVFYLDSATSR